MSDDSTRDPFAAFGSDRTVIKPSGGRGPRADAPAPTPPPQPTPGAGAPLAIDALMGASINPLVAAAQPLLAAAPRLRTTARHPNPSGLKDALAEGIRKFEAQARNQGLPNDQIVAARYVLCTLLDEAAASTPWGGSGAWSEQSLLVQFHNETWGGEKVFQLMSKLAENVAGNRNLLELLYVALCFGFEGRYRVIDNGRAQLDGVRQRLSQLLKQQRERPDPAMSPRWQGQPAAATRLRDGIPLWVVGALTALVLALVFVGLRLSLSSKADSVFGSLQALDAKAAQLAAPTPPPVAAAKPRLAQLLKPDIDAGTVEVLDLADRSVVTIKGDGLFEPGSAVLAGPIYPLLSRIAQAMGSLPGQILITGHTDNQPIRTLRFPSNWHLSNERAEAVRGEFAKTLPSNRLRGDGRADGSPVADNATPLGRARNRRVELTLFAQPA